MRPAVCVHAHFYQPPREDPWSGEVPCEPSAAPHHDWNHRITTECYEPVAAARILREDGDVQRIVNLYERLNFNVGPTLGAWLDRHAPGVIGAMRAADAVSCARHDGHGGAIAQPFVHAILPLASRRDRDTLITWGLVEFAHRFGRAAEGMWLPETAVDTPTLEALVAHGVRFTIVAPHQIRGLAHGAHLDAGYPARVDLPSGRSIALFAYNGLLSHRIAFGDLLRHGDALADELTMAVRTRGGLSHVATDGETFGHHHKFGEMALAWALEAIDADPAVDLTTYGAFLAACPVEQRGVLEEATSWSCVHGIERWRSACGCAAEAAPARGLSWRAPLREAIDFAVGALADLTDQRAGAVLRDPWAARDEYVDAVLDAASLPSFLARHALPAAHGPALAWMRAHEHLLLAQSSCGWFFDDFDGVESSITLRRLSAAVSIVRELTGHDWGPAIEATFASVHAKSGTGVTIWRRLSAP